MEDGMKPADVVLKDARIWNAGQWVEGDLAIAGETISEIGSRLAGRREIPCSGAVVLPGAIDVHTHFSLPFAGAVSADDFRTGTRAAAFGGVTCIIDFLAQEHGEGIQAGWARRNALAEGQADLDYSFHSCIREWNPQVEADLPWARAHGLTSLKMFLAYRRSGSMIEDDAFFTALGACRREGILPTVHAESGRIIDVLTDRELAAGTTDITGLPRSRPVFTENEAVERACRLAAAADADLYIVHLSAGSSLESIRRHRAAGARIHAETCPQYLFLDDSVLVPPRGHLFSCCPPLRPAAEAEELRHGVRDGTIDVVGTDHCPFPSAQKDQGRDLFTRLPMGLPGVETLVPLLLDAAVRGEFPVEVVVQAFSERPARLFGLFPRKGVLCPGADADLMVVDLSQSAEIRSSSLHMALDYSIFESRNLQGQILLTMARGEVVVERGAWTGRPGRGRFVFRAPFDHALSRSPQR
jgi:dihydropyrimidinase